MYKIQIEWTEIQEKILADFSKKDMPINVVPNFDSVPCRKCGIRGYWRKTEIDGKSFVQFFCFPCEDKTELYEYEAYVPNPKAPWRDWN